MNGLFNALNLPLSSPLERRNKAADTTDFISTISGHDLRCIEQFYSADYSRFGYELAFLRSMPLVQYWNTSAPPDLVGGNPPGHDSSPRV